MPARSTIQRAEQKSGGVVSFLQMPTNRAWLAGLFLVCAVFIAYQPAWHAGFIWDDDQHITANPCIVGPLGFKQIWTGARAMYFPLTLSSFWVQHALWGLNPIPYHLVNILMQAVCGLLLWGVLQSLNVRGAWLGAALWTLHPVQTESVAWITELKNTQSGCLYLLAILAFLKWQSEAASAKPLKAERYYILALVCAVLAILSKASTVMLPVVLGLCLWWREGRWQWRNGIRLAPFFMISAVAGLWTIWEQRHYSGASGTEWAQSWPERFVIAGRDIWFYLGKLAWPHPLMFLYPRWHINPAQSAVYLPALTAGAVLLVLWLKRTGPLRPAFFALAYFLVSVFPVLDFFNAYFFRYSFVEDHLQYLASMGPLALAGAGITAGLDYFKARKRLLQPAVCAALPAMLAVLTWHQSRMYHDIQTLWRTAIASNPKAFLAYNNLGTMYLDAGQVNKAMPYFQEALESNPDYPEGHSNIGVALMRTGRTTEGLLEVQKAVALDPDNAESQYNLGKALMEMGQTQGATEHLQKALEINPGFTKADNNLGIIFLQRRQFAEASIYFKKAISLDPKFAEAQYNLGGVYELQGDLARATVQFRKAIEINPDYVHAHRNLADALAAQGKLDEAVREYYRTLALAPDLADVHYRLGVVFQQQNKTADAIAEYQAAVRLDPKQEQAKQRLRVLGAPPQP
jgi:protein O-mannosyl-transferase